MIEPVALVASIAAFGNLGLFAFIGVLILALIFSSKTESFFMGVASLIIGVSAFNYIFAIPVITSIVTNPILSIVAVLVFLSVGALYAGLFQVKEFVKKNSKYIVSDYNDWKSSQIRYNKDANVAYDVFLKSTSYNYSIRKNKDRVASWVLLWPLSVTWKLINNPVVWLIDTVYYGLGHILENINRDEAKNVLSNNDK